MENQSTVQEAEPKSQTKAKVTSLRKMVQGARKAMERKQSARPEETRHYQRHNHLGHSESLSTRQALHQATQRSRPCSGDLHSKCIQSDDRSTLRQFLQERHSHGQTSHTQLRESLPRNHILNSKIPHFSSGSNDDEVSLGSVEGVVQKNGELGMSTGCMGSSWSTLDTSAGSGTFPNVGPSLAMTQSFNASARGTFGGPTSGLDGPAATAPQATTGTTSDPNQSVGASSWGTLGASSGSFHAIAPSLTLRNSMRSSGKYSAGKQSWGNLSLCDPL